MKHGRKGGYRNLVGWYDMLHPEKFIEPSDNFMGSFKLGKVQYKSKLELTSFKYCDFNPRVKRWSLEPLPIPYIKPTDNLLHRYFVDLYIEFNTGHKFLVEIKSSSETKPPKMPRKRAQKTELNYNKAVITYAVNAAKWEAAEKFATENNMQFAILTEHELYAQTK